MPIGQEIGAHFFLIETNPDAVFVDGAKLNRNGIRRETFDTTDVYELSVDSMGLKGRGRALARSRQPRHHLRPSPCSSGGEG